MTSSEEYDYVVVGAGTAGCVVAARLTEDPRIRVALVEAGGPDVHPDITTPLAAPGLFGTAYDWAFRTEPQPGLSGRALDWPGGRTLGGSSSINFQMWVPGHPADWQPWAEVDGSWGWPAVAKYLRGAENWTGLEADRQGFGAGGPLDVSPPRDPDPSTRRFLDACAEAGIEPMSRGLSDPDDSGAVLTPVNQRDGSRFSAADGYLRPALARPNLTVLTDRTVRRVELDDAGRAVGVRLDDLLLTARAEVILCAGAVGSPHLLMLSGIGPAGVLQAAGLPCRVALPGVGEGLRDHLLVDLAIGSRGPHRFLDPDGPDARLRYTRDRAGPLTSNIGEAVGFARADGGAGPPDLELFWAPMAFGADGGWLPGHTLSVMLLQPESTGRIVVTGTGQPPRIDPGYLHAEADVRTLAAGIDVAERVLDAPALRAVLTGPLHPWPEPGPARDAWIRENAGTVFHPVGTCRMGAAANPQSVVDADLRVHGVPRLRVIDASVAPSIPRGHTHAMAVTVGERGAELLAAGRTEISDSDI